jgi:hypothetical protein
MGSVVASLVGARLRHAGRRWWLVAVGIAAGAAIPVLVAGSSAVTADAALRRSIAALPTGERSVTVSHNGFLDAEASAEVDTLVRDRLGALSEPGAPSRVLRQLLFRPLADRTGETFALGSADDLPAGVRLLDGRLPTSCTPTRCEVVGVRDGVTGARDPAPKPELGLVIVGHVSRTDPYLLTGTFEPDPGVPILLADGVDAAATLATLALFQRSYGWIAPLDLAAVRHRGAPAWIDDATRVADDLYTSRGGLVVTAPDEMLLAEDRRARASTRRFAVLGGTAGVLLLGAAVAGGAALRRDHAGFVGALQRRGAPPWRLGAVIAGEVAATAAAGAVAGLVLGAVVTGVLAARAGLPVLTTSWDAVLAGGPAVVALALVGGVLLAVTLRWGLAGSGPSRDPDPQRVWHAVALACIGCAAVAALLAARGEADVARSDPLLPTLPALVLLAAGLLAARCWPPVVHAAQRVLPRRAVGARIGVSAVAAHPLRAAATVALLTAAVGGAVFAGAYRATLDRGAADQAAFAVPATATITPGRGAERPLAVAAPEAYAEVAPGAQAYGVLRTAGSVGGGPQQGEAVQVLGLDPAALTRATRWDAVTGGDDAQAVARGIAAADADPGVPLPPGRTLRIPTPGGGVTLAITAWVRAADGRERGIPMAVTRTGGDALTGTLPDLGAQLHLVAVSLRLPADTADRRQHALGESDRDTSAPAGTIRFGPLSVDGRVVDDAWTGWAGRGLTAATAGGDGVATLRYVLQGDELVLDARPGGPGADTPLIVAADPKTAAGGVTTIMLEGAGVKVRPVAVLPRFPTVSGRFVVADLDALARVVDRVSPGLAEPGEVWLDVPAGGEAGARAGLAQAPLDRVAVRWRSDTEHALRTDPIAQGAVALLLGGTALTLAVALAAVVLLVVTARHDDAGELYAWEADGVPPRTLRAALWWRAATVAALGVPVGVVTGLLLARLTARLVAATAAGRVPQPPLVAGAGAGSAVLAVAAGLALALAVAGMVAARSLREPLPVQARGVS